MFIDYWLRFQATVFTLDASVTISTTCLKKKNKTVKGYVDQGQGLVVQHATEETLNEIICFYLLFQIMV